MQILGYFRTFLERHMRAVQIIMDNIEELSWELQFSLRIKVVDKISAIYGYDFCPRWLNLMYLKAQAGLEPVNRLTGHLYLDKPVLGS